MLILAVDTSTRAGSLALLRISAPDASRLGSWLDDRQVLATVSDSQEVPYASRLFTDLALLQAQAGFTLREVDLFAVAAGPGSFTGLRVGLSAVKAWAEVYDKPIAAVSGLEAVAVQALAPARFGERFVASCIDARRGALFGAIYGCEGPGAHLNLIGEESLLSAEEFGVQIRRHCGSNSVVVASPTPDALSLGEGWRKGLDVRIEAVSPVLAPAIGLLGFERASRGDVVTALDLDANYIRRSDAEVKKGS